MRKARGRRKHNNAQRSPTNNANSDGPSHVHVPSNSHSGPGRQNQHQQQLQYQQQLQHQQQLHYQSSQNNASTSSSQSPTNFTGDNGQLQPPQQPQRKPISPTEAGLTAKNYRLAKELADLRTKHREEMKTVTRLTMENMNLASRCRIAFQQIDKLNKELDMYREKAAEVLFRQRHNERSNVRSPLELSTTTNSPMSSGDSRKRVKKVDKVEKHQLQPQDNNDLLSPMTASTSGGDSSTNSAEADVENIIFGPLSNNKNSSASKQKYAFEKENKQQLTMDSEDYNNKQSNFKSSQSENQQNHKPSLTKKKNDGRRADVSDVAFGELQSEDFFSGARQGATTFENSLPATPEKENVHVDTATTSVTRQFQNFHIDDEGLNESLSNEDNSIDAFEASFQTAFPSSFAHTPSEHTSSLDEMFSDSNSFFSSSENIDESVSSRGNEHNNEQSLFPDTFGDHVVESPTVSTPSKDKSESGDVENLEPPAPPSEKQTGGAAARARYKYALADPDKDIAPMDEAEADRSETSPSLVLQRLQQRKKIDKMSPNSIGSSDSSSQSNINRTTRSTTISEEIRKLDAIANGSFVPQQTNTSGSSSRRRNVKQPISYAEPTLKSKLRRGDVFFPKGDVIDNEANTETAVIS